MELWLPWVEIVGLALIPAVLFGLTVKLKRAHPESFIVPAQVVSAIVSIPILFFSLFLLTAQGYEENRGLVGSPDSKHVARLMIWGSVASGTSVQVIARKELESYMAKVSEAFTVGTLIDPIEPRLSWADNSRLVIDYPAPSDGTGFHCESKRAGDILVVCKTHKGY